MTSTRLSSSQAHWISIIGVLEYWSNARNIAGHILMAKMICSYLPEFSITQKLLASKEPYNGFVPITIFGAGMNDVHHSITPSLLRDVDSYAVFLQLCFDHYIFQVITDSWSMICVLN